MAKTIKTYVGEVGRTLYPIDFNMGYLDKSDIHVYSGEDPNIQLSYTWVNNTQIQLEEPFTLGETFYIRRIVTRENTTNDYEDGAILKESDLDDSFKQAIMILEEFEDGYLSLAEFKLQTNLNLNGFKLINVPRSTGNGEAVEHSQLTELYSLLESYTEAGQLAAALASATSSVKVAEVEARDLKVCVNSLKDLTKYTNTAFGKTFTVLGFYSTLKIHQGDLYWDSGKDKSGHNGVDVFAPEALDAWDGTHANRSTLFNWTGTGIGCFVRSSRGKAIDPYYAGATGLGLVSETLSFAKAGDLCLVRNQPLGINSGTYLGTFDFGRGFGVKGTDLRSVTLRADMSDPTSYCVRMHTTGIRSVGNKLSEIKIECLDPSNNKTGLQIGDLGFTTSCSNPLVKRIEITGFKTNWRFKWCVMGHFEDIYCYEDTANPVADSVGIAFDSEVTAQAINFFNIRTRLQVKGLTARAGHFLNWFNCNFESNRLLGLELSTGIDSGPTSWTFIGCDIEDNGNFPPVGSSSILRTQVFLDMNPAIVNEKGMDIVFENCVINSPADLPIYDVYASRAQNVYFKKTKFTQPLTKIIGETTLNWNGFSSSRFGFNSGTNAVKIYMEDCSTIQKKATPTMYDNMPALVTSGGNTYGYHYNFRSGKKKYSNYENPTGVAESVTTDVTAYDIRGVGALVVDTASGNVNINSLSKGLEGQKLSIVKTNPANSVVLKHSGVTGGLLMPTGIDVTLANRQGAMLQFFGGNWYLVS